MSRENEKPFVQCEQTVLYSLQQQGFLQNPGGRPDPAGIQYIAGE